jgi:energy-coupling factor transporter ATP-binding protein EcfA2
VYLRHVRLRHWGCHEDLAITLEQGVSVCLGPNGVGKSTLYHAIVSALTLRYNSRGEEIQRHTSWGVEGYGPTAQLELMREDGPWRLTKTYLHDPTCLLERWREGQWQADCRGKPAEGLLEHWLEGDGAAGRLVLALWSPQHDSTQLFEAASRSEKVGRATMLEQVLDRVGRPERAGPFGYLKQVVDQHYSRIFTAERRQIRKGSDLDLARRSLRDAEGHLEDLRRRRDELTARVDAFLARQQEHQVDIEHLAALHAEAEQRRVLVQSYQRGLEALGEAEERLNALRETLRQREHDHQRCRQVAEELVRTEEQIKLLIPAREAARNAVEEAVQRLARVEDQHRSASLVLDQLATVFETRKRLEELRLKVTEAQRSEQTRRTVRDRALQSRDEAFRRWDQARTETAEAQRRLSAARHQERRITLRLAEHAKEEADRRLLRAEAEQLLLERSRLLERWNRVSAWEQERRNLDPGRDGGPVPSNDELDELRRLAFAVHTQERTLAADGVTLQLRPETALRARVTVDRQSPQDLTLGPGEVVELRAVAQLVVEMPGMGRFEVGRTAVEQLVSRLVDCDRQRQLLGQRLLDLNATDLDALEDRKRRAESRQRLQEQIDGVLAGETREELAVRLAEVNRRLEPHGIGREAAACGPPETPVPLDVLRRRRDEAARNYEAARATVEADPTVEFSPDETTPTVEEAEAQLKTAQARELESHQEFQQAESARAAAEAEWQVARTLSETARSELQDESHGALEAELFENQMKIDAWRHQLQLLMSQEFTGETREATRLARERLVEDLKLSQREHEAAARELGRLDSDVRVAESTRERLEYRRLELRAEVPLADDSIARQEAIHQLQREIVVAETDVERLRTALPADAVADNADFESRLQALEARRRATEAELLHRRGELDALGAEGLDSRVAAAEEARDQARREVERLTRDASAWALLQHLLETVESELARSVAARIEALATETLPRLTADDVCSVKLNPADLTPIQVTARGPTLQARIERFSRGTREQVALACRLEIGRLLGRQFRQVLLLDDPLAHTDPTRHREALDVLSELSQSLQIVIFTCHQDRYAPLWEVHDAGRIDLPRRRSPARSIASPED